MPAATTRARQELDHYLHGTPRPELEVPKAPPPKSKPTLKQNTNEYSKEYNKPTSRRRRPPEHDGKSPKKGPTKRRKKAAADCKTDMSPRVDLLPEEFPLGAEFEITSLEQKNGKLLKGGMAIGDRGKVIHMCNGRLYLKMCDDADRTGHSLVIGKDVGFTTWERENCLKPAT